MKNKKGLLFIALMLIILFVLYLSMFINSKDNNAFLNYLFFGFIIILGLYITTLIINRKKNIQARQNFYEITYHE
jgi:hypothetical protein